MRGARKFSNQRKGPGFGRDLKHVKIENEKSGGGMRVERNRVDEILTKSNIWYGWKEIKRR